ncbi:hypothetical protein EYZ11_000251 [Aspergillus tanneri]|uniref:Major facilitator superfamily (MFS) profile domain-containing protein n=1 Tax=Aspergillus tanneri TaxID=1220188 RepID=A0A4S3JY07_9EURO|nr:uncharacterized protein ATNIH1004_006480 [Aspergillus tanneri]KAA8647779.1 hypothetical protein ATNIH1004_006480 [Aspergillus tanneri]THD00358.1 hypothetical protein EYZ11_000251 [Aspergillus tanneri]
MTALAASLSSSAYAGVSGQLGEQFNVGSEVVVLGISLFVLGFAAGPFFFAPVSELYGRQIVVIGSYSGLAIFNGAAAASQNIWTLIILRFFAGVCGSSTLTNSVGQVADIFEADLRGLAMSLLVLAPFVGPALGPIIGGYIGEAGGWRWVQGFMGLFTAWAGALAALVTPETYAPVLLKQRARVLSRLTGLVYRSKLEVEQGQITLAQTLRTAIIRPWVLLILEPIVLFLSLWIAIVYGMLYMFFASFPIVYQEIRGWSPGPGGLAFVGVAVGMVVGVLYAIPENLRYNRKAKTVDFMPPEERLWPALVGAPLIPASMFWFAWTNSPNLSAAISIASGVPFGFGMVSIYLSIANYLVDGYLIYAASALAANALLRSIFGAVFPLFTDPMYHNLGIHWASCIPAFLALACVPLPYLLFLYGARIRKRCKYAAEAERVRLAVTSRR